MALARRIFWNREADEDKPPNHPQMANYHTFEVTDPNSGGKDGALMMFTEPCFEYQFGGLTLKQQFFSGKTTVKQAWTEKGERMSLNTTLTYECAPLNWPRCSTA